MKKLSTLMRKFSREEKGAIIVMFALLLPVLLTFVGAGTDLGMMYIKRARLLEVGHIIRNARFNETIIFNNSENPATTFDDLAKYYAGLNGIEGTVINSKGVEVDRVSTNYKQTLLTQTRRDYTVDIYLNDNYKYCFLNILGFESKDINVTINGSGYEENSNGVWAPGR
jgi:hypothetical protein